MIGATLAGRLIETPAVMAVIQDRIYPKRLPQGKALPAVTYDVEPKSTVQSLGGPMSARQERVRFTSYATDYRKCQAASESIRAALDGFRGTINTTRIGHVLLMASGPETFDPQEGQDGGTYADTLEFDVFYYV